MSDKKDTEAPKIDWRAFTPADSPMTMPDVLADPRRQALSTPTVEPGGAAYDFSGPVYDFSQGKQIIISTVEAGKPTPGEPVEVRRVPGSLPLGSHRADPTEA